MHQIVVAGQQFAALITVWLGMAEADFQGAHFRGAWPQDAFHRPGPVIVDAGRHLIIDHAAAAQHDTVLFRFHHVKPGGQIEQQHEAEHAQGDGSQAAGGGGEGGDEAA